MTAADKDIRIKILNAFNRLIRKKDFPSVTVGEIAKEAQISRATFYRHFHDKYDVMNYNFKSFLRKNIEQHPLKNITGPV